MFHECAMCKSSNKVVDQLTLFTKKTPYLASRCSQEFKPCPTKGGAVGGGWYWTWAVHMSRQGCSWGDSKSPSRHPWCHHQIYFQFSLTTTIFSFDYICLRWMPYWKSVSVWHPNNNQQQTGMSNGQKLSEVNKIIDKSVALWYTADHYHSLSFFIIISVVCCQLCFSCQSCYKSSYMNMQTGSSLHVHGLSKTKKCVSSPTIISEKN